MNGATMALLECINESEHYLVHTLDSVLIKHAVVEALEKIAFLRARVEVLEEALRFYANMQHYQYTVNSGMRMITPVVSADKGAIARAALAGGGKEGEDDG